MSRYKWFVLVLLASCVLPSFRVLTPLLSGDVGNILSLIDSLTLLTSCTFLNIGALVSVAIEKKRTENILITAFWLMFVGLCCGLELQRLYLVMRCPQECMSNKEILFYFSFVLLLFSFFNSYINLVSKPLKS